MTVAMGSFFKSIEEKQAYRQLEKLHWRVLQLHQIRVEDDDCFFDRAEELQEEIDEIKKEIDELVPLIRRGQERSRNPQLRKVR